MTDPFAAPGPQHPQPGAPGLPPAPPYAAAPQQNWSPAPAAPGPVDALAGPVDRSQLLMALAGCIGGGFVLMVLLAVTTKILSPILLVVGVLAGLYVSAHLRTSKLAPDFSAALAAAPTSAGLHVLVAAPRSLFTPVWNMRPTVLHCANGTLAVEGHLAPTPLSQLSMKRASFFSPTIRLSTPAGRVRITAVNRLDIALYFPLRLNDALAASLAAGGVPSQGPVPAPVQPAWDPNPQQAPQQVQQSPHHAPQPAPQPAAQPAAPGPAAAPTQPGWYPDPWGQARVRWFDGRSWTAQVA